MIQDEPITADQKVHMTPEDYLKDRLNDQIDWYDRKGGINKKMYQRCQLIQIIMASLITLSAIFEVFDYDWISFLVPVLGAIVAIVSGVLGLYKFQENWVEYRTTSEQLKYEKYLFLTNSEPYHEPESFHLLVGRVEGLISKQNSSWFQNTKEVAEGEIS